MTFGPLGIGRARGRQQPGQLALETPGTAPISPYGKRASPLVPWRVSRRRRSTPNPTGDGAPLRHPQVKEMFTELKAGRYEPRRQRAN